MTNIAEAKPKLPLIIFLGMLLFTTGCSSDKQPASGDAASQAQPQGESRKPSDVDWATGTAQSGSSSQQPASSAGTQPISSETGYATVSDAPAVPTPQQAETAETAATSPTDDPAAAARKKLDQLKTDETYIVKYIEKVQQRLETEQDPNFRAGYERGLQQARENYETNKKDLQAAEQELAAATKKQ